ncbi:MAG: restriction endonuclease subunit S [Paenalcaligenes sp.]
MTSEWKKGKIKDFGRIVTGKTPPTVRTDFFEGPIPFLTPTDMLDGRKTVRTSRTLTTAGLESVKNCLVPKGVAVSCIGWQMGKTVLINTPTVTNQQINTIVVDESKFDLSFVYYLLASMREKIFELGATPTRTPIVNKTTFGEIPVFIPPFTEQRKIASIGAALDDRITLLRETNKTLESIAQAIFKSWFVDFDPVRAKMEGRQPEGMDEETATLFPNSLEESELGLVPKGWQTSSLAESCSYLKRGLSPKYLEKGGVLVLNQKCVRDFSIDFKKARRHDNSQRAIAGRTIEVGDVLVNSTGVGTLGRVAQVLDLPETTIADSHLTIVRAGSTMNPAYLGEWMQRNQTIIESMGEGTTGQTELSRVKLGELRLLTPPSAIQLAFATISLSLKSKIVVNSHTSASLEAIRDTLLPRLISGQLRLPEAQEKVEDALS